MQGISGEAEMKSTWIKTTLVAVFAMACLTGEAVAIDGGDWIGTIQTSIKGKILDEGGKTVAKMVDAFEVENIRSDTDLQSRIRMDIAPAESLPFPAVFNNNNLNTAFKKGKAAGYLGVIQDLTDAFPVLTWQASTDTILRAKPKVTVEFINFDAVKPKGSIKTKKNAQKLIMNVTFKFEGVVGGAGEYAGQRIKGKFKVKYKADRVVADE